MKGRARLSWPEECAMRFVELMGGYERQLQGFADTFAVIDARLEGVSAVAYDHDGGKAAYTDKRPALLDLLDETTDKARSVISAHHDEYTAALELFCSNPNAEIVWLKWGRRLTWKETAAAMNFSIRAAMRREHAGLMAIYQKMPPEYRQKKGEK